MNKRMMVLFVGLFVFMFGIVTNAKETYYVNDNGVEMSQYEYVFLQNFYFDRFPEHITQEQFDELKANDLFNGTVERVTYEEPSSSSDDDSNGSRSPTHDTSAKLLVITKSCGTTCTVSLQATWHYSPTIRSYDDIGFYFFGSSMSSHLFTAVSSTTEYQTFSNIKTGTYGWGNTVKLPQTGSNVVVLSTVIMNTGGHLYGSYQHAVQNTTLNVAKDYTFALGGYGHVFLFGNSATNVYDGMGGVDIAL